MLYEPYPIADYNTGIQLDKQPWLQPANAFVALNNARVFRGRLEKRAGYEFWKELGTYQTENIGTVTFNSGTLAYTNLLGGEALPSLYVVTSTDGTIACTEVTGYVGSDLGKIYLWETPNTVPAYAGTVISDTINIGHSAEGDGIRPGSWSYTDGSGVSVEDDGAGNIVDVGTPANPLSGAGFDDIDYDDGDIRFTVTNPLTGPQAMTWDLNAIVIVKATGEWYVDYRGASVADTVITFEYNRGLPVMGIHDYKLSTGTSFLIAQDTRRLFEFNSVEQRFYDIIQSDKWSGESDEYMWYAPFEARLHIDNGNDTCQWYGPPDSPRVQDRGVDVDGDTVDDIDWAKIILRHKGRLVYLFTQEGSIEYPQRARWSPVNDVEYGAATSYQLAPFSFADAPTEDKIVSAHILGDQIIVQFTRSIWKMRFLGDGQNVYAWEQMHASEGATSRMSSVVIGDILYFRGETRMMGCDGHRVKPVDSDIPDVVPSWNPDEAEDSFGILVPEFRQGVWSYADSNEIEPTKALIMQFDDNYSVISWSTYDLPFYAWGRYRQGGTLTIDEVTGAIDSIDTPINEMTLAVGLPLTLAGDGNSAVFKYGTSQSDNGNAIQMNARSVRLNPWKGIEAHLGWIDFYLDKMASGLITIRLYRDYSTAPYLTDTIDATSADVLTEKVKRRIGVYETAAFHTIEIEYSGVEALKIDAVVPYFGQRGELRDIG